MAHVWGRVYDASTVRASASSCERVDSGAVIRTAVDPLNTARKPSTPYAASPSPGIAVTVTTPPADDTARSPEAKVARVSS